MSTVTLTLNHERRSFKAEPQETLLCISCAKRRA